MANQCKHDLEFKYLKFFDYNLIDQNLFIGSS